MKKIKVILPFITTINFHKVYEGGNKYVDSFSKELANQGIDVTVVTTLLENKKTTTLNKDGVKYVFIPPKTVGKRLLKLNTPYNLLFSHNLRKYLEKIDFDILHSFNEYAYSYLHKPKRKRKPVITQTWGFAPFYLPEPLSQKGIKKLYLKHFIQHLWLYSLRKSDLVATEGDFELPKIRELGIDENKAAPIPIGIDPKIVKEYKKKHKNIRKKLNISKDDFVMIAVNQIAPDKGVEDVINAFALIKKEIKNAKLIFVGSGKLEPVMHELVNKHNLKNDFFHLKGISEQELFNCYFSSDLFVNAQSQQNWSMSVQEAMACGLPIVSFENIVLNEHNKTGIVVKDRTPKGIKEGILKIYHGDKGKMKKRALELTNEYSWENIVKTAIKEYKKLLKE